MSGKSFVSVAIAFVFIFTGMTGCAKTPSVEVVDGGGGSEGGDNGISASWTDDNRISVSLDPVEGATAYVIYAATRSDLSPALNVLDDDIYDHWFAAPGSDGRVTLQTDKYPAGDGIHYVIVTAIVSDNQETSPSDVLSVIPSVSINSATYNEATNEISVSWAAVSGAVSYRLYGGYDSTLSRTNFSVSYAATGTTHTLIAPADQFFFVVTAVNDFGVEGAFGQVYSFSKVTVESGCSEGHKWLDGSDPYWTYVDCGSSSSKFIDQSTVDTLGAALGSQSVEKGLITFSSTGTSNSDFGSSDTFSLFVHAQGNGGAEVNWHWHSYSVGGDIESRLTTQRFDGVCSSFCEERWISRSLQYYNTADVFDWKCDWDAGGVACVVSKNGNTVAESIVVPTKGRYYALNYIGVGTGAFKGPYPSAPFTISNFRVSFFR